MKRLVYFIITLLTCASCKERYNITLPPTQTGFLVVEGFINTSGVTEIKLSRTTLVDAKNMQFEKNAVVRIEADDNTIFPLAEKDSGKYVSPTLQLDLNKKYRLNIKTSEDKEYISSYEAPIITPSIDSITWIRYNDGIEIYVNAIDRQNNTRYYRWEYDETWEFKSQYATQVYVDFQRDQQGLLTATVKYRDSVHNLPVDTLYTCWQSKSSSAIKIGSTEKLGDSRVYSPVIFYPRGAWELSYLYSVLIRQYGLTKEGYEFYNKIKKNTESLGTIFDAQPSEIKGNIKNSNDEEELVLGYVGVNSVTEKRVFISNKDLEGWNYFSGCEQEIIVMNEREKLIENFYNDVKIPTVPLFMNGALVAVKGASDVCVDCRLRGTNIKPSFWP